MILNVANISKSFGRIQVLNGVSCIMEPASVYGIVGENGSGKSTLLKIIVGEWKPDGGQVTCSGSIGYCPQKIMLFPQLTIDEHFRYFAKAYSLTGQHWKEQSEMLMDFFSFKKFRSERTERLSGGTQQKLNLAIALLHKPDILILDEPYSGFDWHTYLQFWHLTDQLRGEGCAILIVSHLIAERERFDQIFNLEMGVLT